LINNKVSFFDDKQAVWAASHYRAITDIVLHLVNNKDSDQLHKHLQFDEWFSLLVEKQRVYGLLKLINEKGGLNVTDWVNVERWIENEIYLNHYRVVNRADNLSNHEVNEGKKYFEDNFQVDTRTWSYRG
jgi:hypothetical protein